MVVFTLKTITLLNVDLKIFTRTLASRMAKVLPKLIHHNQTCVPGRNMASNIHIMQDFVDVLIQEGKGAALILLDDEKAFDRMSHSFIIKTLRRFGFGEKFIGWVKMVYTDTSSSVKVNGYSTESFPIERGVRQGCPLSALLYVLCAEVFSTAVRSNVNIIGYKFNNGREEHKITQYADDKVVYVTTEGSVTELFDVIDKFDSATNSRNNKDKTEGLLVGTFTHYENFYPAIDWETTNGKCLGACVGNDRYQAAVKIFEEIIEKVKLKMSYWSSKYLSLIGRIKTLNIFVLSKLWSVLESQDIPNHLLKILNNLISDFVWNDLHQCQFSHLHDEYQDGGLNLQDIELKMKALRVKWLRYLVTKENCHIEKFLANKLIGKLKQIFGLKILNASDRYDKNIPSSFYKNAVVAWRILSPHFFPVCINDIRRDWVYDNILLKDDDGRVFKPPSFIPPYAPEYMYDLPVTANPREFRGVFKRLIPAINKAFMKLKYSSSEKCVYKVDTVDGLKDINCFLFCDIYNYILHKRPPTVKPWKLKWESDQKIDVSEWKKVWSNVHHPTLSGKVQSSLWELLHRNFMCAYFEKIAFNGSGVCKLCNTIQNERTHIFVTCEIINRVYSLFLPLLNSILEVNTMTQKEMIMGLDISNYENGNRTILRNYVTSFIKHVVFRSRNSSFGNDETTVNTLAKKIKSAIRADISSKFFMAKNTHKIDSFSGLFLFEGLLGSLRNGSITFTESIM